MPDKDGFSEWQNLLANSVYANAFHCPAMAELLRSVPGYSVETVTVYDCEKCLKVLIMAVIQKESSRLIRFFSRRAIVFGGPILDEKDPQIGRYLEEALLQLNTRLKGKAIYVEFRNLHDYTKFRDVFRRCGYVYRPHLNFQVPCADEAVMKQKFSKSKLRQIKSSLRMGASIVVPKTQREVEQFIDLLRILYREKIRKPLPPKQFFLLFFNRPQLGKYFLVKYQGNIIGGIMCPVLPGRVIYEWYICGMDGKFKGIYPSVLATWAALDYGNKNGFNYFDFMGAGKPNSDYGVREFKSKFGGTEVEFGRFGRINNRLLYRMGKLGLKIRGMIR